MSYENVGAYVDSKRPKTKKALREALNSNPDSVVFDATSVFTHVIGSIQANNLPEGVTLTVVGPDPYTLRKWYASVTRGSDGKPKIS